MENNRRELFKKTGLALGGFTLLAASTPSSAIAGEPNNNHLSVSSYQDLKGYPSQDVSNGQVILLTQSGIAGLFVVKSGAQAGDFGIVIVFDDDPNRYAERIVSDIVQISWFEPDVDSEDSAWQLAHDAAENHVTAKEVHGEKGAVYQTDRVLRVPPYIKSMGNGATIRTTLTSYIRGSTPGLAAVIANKNADSTNGTVIDSDIEIAGWNIISSSDVVMSTIYIANTNNAHIHHNTCIAQEDASDLTLSHIDLHHTNTNTLVEFNHLTNSSLANTYGACASIRNASSSHPSSGITFRSNYLYKNSPNATDELMFMNGGDGVVRNVLFMGNTIESGPEDNTSSQVTIYPFTNSGAITTSDILYVKITDNHFITPANVNNALLLGISTDVKKIRHLIIKGNTFDLDGNTAISMQSPVSHCVISENSCHSTSTAKASFCIATNDANNLGCFAQVKNNTLEGNYGIPFLGNYVVGNDCDKCDIFAKDARSVLDNHIDEVRHNLVNDTKFGGRVSGNVASFVDRVVRSPNFPYVFYVPHNKVSSISGNDITFKDNGFKMLFTNEAGSASKISFDLNRFSKDGATDSPRMDLGSAPKELASSRSNVFYGVTSDSIYSPPNNDFGVPGFIPALGHVTFYNDVEVGSSQAIGQIRVLGGTLKLKSEIIDY